MFNTSAASNRNRFLNYISPAPNKFAPPYNVREKSEGVIEKAALQGDDRFIGTVFS